MAFSPSMTNSMAESTRRQRAKIFDNSSVIMMVLSVEPAQMPSGKFVP